MSIDVQNWIKELILWCGRSWASSKTKI